MNYKNKTVTLTWQAGGCLEVDSTWVAWKSYSENSERNATDGWGLGDYRKAGYSETKYQSGKGLKFCILLAFKNIINSTLIIC